MNRSIDRFEEDLRKELARARAILSKGDGFFASNLENIFHEFDVLNIGSSEEIWPIVRKLLEEIKPEYYIKPKIQSAYPHLSLFGFTWMSSFFKRFVTFQFALNGEYFFYISLR